MAQATVTEDNGKPPLVDVTYPRQYKQRWWRRSRDRGIYHETEFIKKLEKFGWARGRRIPVSGPFLGWADAVATRDQPDVYRIGLFQLKPRLRTLSTYFSGKAILGLMMLETMYEPKFHRETVRVEKVLIGIMRKGSVYHTVTPDDILKVGLTDSVLGRISLTDPVASMRIMQHLPSPETQSHSGRPLNNFYDYLGSMNVVLHARDPSTWEP